MKKFLLISLLQILAIQLVHSQQNRFNVELDKFCRSAVKDLRNIDQERKIILDEIAQQLSDKKYIVFTCRTNSRRTVMLQVWAQTAFYYYGLFGKYAFSLGDTVTGVYAGVADVLAESGFYVNTLASEPNGYIISINKEYPESIVLSKNMVGTIDTAKGIVVNICSEGEQPGLGANKTNINLPYQSPVVFEKKPQEKQKYSELNRQIAVEMLYLAEKTQGIITQTEKGW